MKNPKEASNQLTLFSQAKVINRKTFLNPLSITDSGETRGLIPPVQNLAKYLIYDEEIFYLSFPLFYTIISIIKKGESND